MTIMKVNVKMNELEFIETSDGIVWMYIPEAEEFIKTDYKVEEE